MLFRSPRLRVFFTSKTQMGIAPERRTMTEIFDQTKALQGIHSNAFAISNDIRDMEAAKKTSAPVDIVAPGFNDEAFKAQMSNAFLSHYENSLPRPEKDVPSTPEIFGAAFRLVTLSALRFQTARFGRCSPRRRAQRQSRTKRSLRASQRKGCFPYYNRSVEWVRNKNSQTSWRT